MSMSSRASLWFGCEIQGDNPPDKPPTSTPQPLPPPPSATTPVPNDQLIYERYFQKVTLRDFQHSTLLLQYASERRVTPAVLWHQFLNHVASSHIENNLANLIEYLSITSKPKPTLQTLTSPKSYFYKKEESPQKRYLELNRRMFPMRAYTREDFLKSKREAEEAFEKKIAEVEKKKSKEQKSVHGKSERDERSVEKKCLEEQAAEKDEELDTEVTEINRLQDCTCDYE